MNLKWKHENGLLFFDSGKQITGLLRGLGREGPGISCAFADILYMYHSNTNHTLMATFHF